MSMKTILWCGAGLLLLSRGQRAAQVQQSVAAKLNDPTNWGADQWARLYGDDLAAAGGQHEVQSTLAVYGLGSSMGFIGSTAR